MLYDRQLKSGVAGELGRNPTPGARSMLSNAAPMGYTSGMADFTFNGKILKNRSGQKMGEIDRTFIRAWNSSKLGEIDRKNIRNAQSKKVAEFDGKVVKDDLGNKLAAIQEIQKLIEGPTGMPLVAMWYFFVRK
jgi:hypothetical protein